MYRISFLALLKKDISLVARSKEVWVICFCFVVLLSVTAAIGIQGLFLPRNALESLIPPLLVLIFSTTALFAAERAHQEEYSDGANERLFLLATPAARQFFSKLAAHIFLLSLSFFISFFSLVILLGVGEELINFNFALASIATIVGYSTLVTLFVGTTAGSSLSFIILPVIIVPLSAPLLLSFFTLCQQWISHDIIDNSALWWPLLLLCDLIYLFLGTVLYRYIGKR
jgi:ABC-type transport system involved in cytochrome c biogenesis permease component